MRPSKLSPLALATLLVLGMSGCGSGSTTFHSGRIAPSERKRTPEELRFYEGPFTLRLDSHGGFGSVEIPTGGDTPLSLFLFPEEISKLQALHQSQPFELRYWFSEEAWLSDRMFGRGELVSIRNNSGVILDRSRCELHKLDMVRRPVPISYGLPMEEFLKAMKRDFPHPAFTLGGCVVDDGSPKKAPCYVCPECDATAKAWSAAFTANRK